MEAQIVSGSEDVTPQPQNSCPSHRPLCVASMASKLPQSPVDSTGQSSHSHLPPPISPANKVLSSIISLPVEPHIVYAIYTPSAADDNSNSEVFELARRQLVSRNKLAEASILESLVPNVCLEEGDMCLRVFRITSHEQLNESLDYLRGLQLDGLTCECSI